MHYDRGKYIEDWELTAETWACLAWVAALHGGHGQHAAMLRSLLEALQRQAVHAWPQPVQAELQLPTGGNGDPLRSRQHGVAFPLLLLAAWIFLGRLRSEQCLWRMFV